MLIALLNSAYTHVLDDGLQGWNLRWTFLLLDLESGLFVWNMIFGKWASKGQKNIYNMDLDDIGRLDELKCVYTIDEETNVITVHSFLGILDQQQAGERRKLLYEQVRGIKPGYRERTNPYWAMPNLSDPSEDTDGLEGTPVKVVFSEIGFIDPNGKSMQRFQTI